MEHHMSDKSENTGSASLMEDLERHANELYSKQDLNAGLNILKEVAGAITVGGFVLTALTVWMPAIGLTVSAGTVAHIMYRSACAYNKASQAERRQIRAAINWIKGGFSLGARLLD
jgi:hypothetical protein